MRKSYLATTGKANSEGASSCTRNEAGLQVTAVIMRAARAFWPSKTALELREATHASERMIQYWLSEKYSLSAGDLAALLRTEAGFAILENIMGEARPTWWKRFRQSVERALIRADLKAAQKRLEQCEMDFD